MTAMLAQFAGTDQWVDVPEFQRHGKSIDSNQPELFSAARSLIALKVVISLRIFGIVISVAV
jgi:hypothetical protein